MIAEALMGRRLARRWEPILKRRKAIEKSATSAERRTVTRHADTIEATAAAIDRPRRIVVVDDVVTSGATLFAATRIIEGVYPDAAVKSFALIRTLSEQDILETPNRCLAPCIGTITLNPDGTTIREP